MSQDVMRQLVGHERGRSARTERSRVEVEVPLAISPTDPQVGRRLDGDANLRQVVDRRRPIGEVLNVGDRVLLLRCQGGAADDNDDQCRDHESVTPS